MRLGLAAFVQKRRLSGVKTKGSDSLVGGDSAFFLCFSPFVLLKRVIFGLVKYGIASAYSARTKNPLLACMPPVIKIRPWADKLIFKVFFYLF